MHRVVLKAETDFDGWRQAARRLRLAQIAPDDVTWSVGDAADLFGGAPPPEAAQGVGFSAPRAFLALAEDVILNRAPERFHLLYRLLWRLRDEPHLVQIVTDPDVDQALRLQKEVRQAEHKMHAFLRLRRVDPPDADGRHDPAQEEYAAWFEPPHYILAKAVPYFVRRLANVRFSIFTPEGSAVWDGRTVSFGPGGDRADAPAEDAREDDWRAYFSSIFNPARLNPKLMTQHMPRAYWRNLPEAEVIGGLIDQAQGRTDAMVQASPTLPPTRAARVAARKERDTPIDSGLPADSLEEVAAAVQLCRRCELWRDATQGVPGEGPGHAPLMFVGEQPGDMEDLRGRPFVGPAGELFNRALAEAGVAREDAYVTNAVKHFKHEMRGKRRLHKTPGPQEVRACRWWLESELKLVSPRVVVSLGATAAAAVFGRAVAVTRERGPQSLRDAFGAGSGGAATGFVTVHPSYLLRLPDEAARREAFAAFVRDLAAAHASAKAA